MPTKPVVVLDTNVIVSGIINPLGTPGAILRRFHVRDFVLITSPEQIEEIRDVFDRPKVKKLIPRKLQPQLKVFLNNFHKITTVIKPPKLSWNFEDEGDYFLLDLISHTKADFLVTGDKALRSLLLIVRTQIITPTEFLANL